MIRQIHSLLGLSSIGRCVAATVLVVMVWAAVPASASDLPRADPESVGFSSERLTRITNFFQEQVDKEIIAGAQTLVARRGKVVHFESIGLADKRHKRLIDETTIFRIASMTKPVTAVALLMLYEEGRFNLTDRVAKHIPEFDGLKVLAGLNSEGQMILEDQVREMTIQDLLTHSSGHAQSNKPEAEPRKTPIEGLYDEAEIGEFSVPLGEMIQRLAQIPLLYQPGTRWHYGIASNIQGHLVERISGLPLDEFMRSRILAPLRMSDTDFYVPKDKRSRLAKTYTHKDGQLVEYSEPMPASKIPALLSGGGGLFSTTVDYLRFAQMLANGGELDGVRILGRKTVDFMRTDHIAHIRMKDSWHDEGLGYGLGVGVVTDPTAAGMLSSKGDYHWFGGRHTSFLIDPEEEIVAIHMIQYKPDSVRYDQIFRILVNQALID